MLCQPAMAPPNLQDVAVQPQDSVARMPSSRKRTGNDGPSGSLIHDPRQRKKSRQSSKDLPSGMSEKDAHALLQQLVEEDRQAWDRVGQLQLEEQQARRWRNLNLGSTQQEQQQQRENDDGGFPVLDDDDDNEEVGNEEEQQQHHQQQQQQQQQQEQQDQEDLGPDWNHDHQINIEPDTDMRRQFREYATKAKDNWFPHLTKDEKRGVRLLDIMRKKKTPLDAYDAISLWHYQESGVLKENDKLKDAHHHISREVLLKRLKKRYNMDGKFPFVKNVTLPHSKANVDLVCHDAADCIESILTDPRLTDDDFMFFNNDPLQAPPKDLLDKADLETGLAYRAAHKKYITKQNQVLLPIIFYIDGAVTGQFSQVPVTALKITLGILNRKYRGGEHLVTCQLLVKQHLEERG